MKMQLLDRVRRNGFYLGIIAGILLSKLWSSGFHHRSVDWLGTINGLLCCLLTIWGIERLWASRKGRRDMGEMKIIAAIVLVGICQFLFLFISIFRGLNPQGIETRIAPVIMLGLVALLIWKGLKSTAI
jgi:hypothetical protein